MPAWVSADCHASSLPLPGLDRLLHLQALCAPDEMLQPDRLRSPLLAAMCLVALLLTTIGAVRHRSSLRNQFTVGDVDELTRSHCETMWDQIHSKGVDGFLEICDGMGGEIGLHQAGQVVAAYTFNERPATELPAIARKVWCILPHPSTRLRCASRRLGRRKSQSS
jgi:hypothetical protein